MYLRFFAIILLYILLATCSNDSKKSSFTHTIPAFEADSISLKLKYSETFFIVPSPTQSSMLIKNSRIGFNEKLLNPLEHIDIYKTSLKKSLALGIWGADLSYLNLYEQKTIALKYMKNVQDLMNDLEILQSVDSGILKRIETNFGNNDSILYYVSLLYRNGDFYLKANDRRDVCALIIAGGWIESFYFLTEIYSETKKKEIFELILYQADILDNLIKLLSPYYKKSEEFTTLIDKLVNIAYEFDVVDKVQSTIISDSDSIHRKTMVKCHTTHLLTGSKMERLSALSRNLRNKIVQ